MKSFGEFISEGSERLVKIKQSGHSANIRRIDDTTSMFSHRGVVGHVTKAWSRMGGWGYQAGNIRVNGKDVGLPVIHGTHKSMNDAIHNAYMHTMHHMSKGGKLNEQQDNKKKFSEPSPERFQKAMPVSGVVVFVKPIVERVKHHFVKYWGWGRTGPKVMRLSVLIRTDEGWTLSGKIGKAMNNADVPDVRVGDHIRIDPIQLDRSHYTSSQRAKGIYTRNTLQRTLTGKVVGRRA